MPFTSAAMISRPVTGRVSASARIAGSVVESAWFDGVHIGSKSSTCMAAPFSAAASVGAVRKPWPSTTASGRAAMPR